ncbi:polyphosphate kinase 1 [Natronomonas marina]|jgi:polyphosphate kinase|uniref:polyphosphate kinase 1 n=1 Tax=Natronomonas marina TaxID=2961939 RepID=UPI0020C9BD39|nr:polyphosphate kinase 1 [Natronomonas marina]
MSDGGQGDGAADGTAAGTGEPADATEPDGNEPGDDASEPTVDLSDPALYLNRELSELAFQRRVLREAEDERNPPLERAKFLAILTKNLDEFFMKRVGGLKQQMAAGVTERTPDGMTPAEQWTAAFETAVPMFERQDECWRDAVRPALAEAGVEVVDIEALTDAERANLRERFEESVLPTLTPLTFDPAHPFPFISNLSLSMAVLTRRSDEEEPTFSRVKIPENRPRFLRVDEGRFVPIEAVVAANLELLFPDVEVVDHAMFRVTRNAEVRRNEEVAEDLIEAIEGVLRDRRFATVVRLEVAAGMSDRARAVLVEQLDLDAEEVVEREGLLDHEDLFDLVELDRPELKIDPWTPQPHPRLVDVEDEGEVFAEIRRGDLLVHHPYHSFEGTVQRFLQAAAHDPDVLAIKAAIYRTADDSKVIEALIDAAKNGKQVAVMVELKARFDEANNLRWVRRLEEEGIHVAYGTIGLKTHTKTSLVVREDDDGVRQYAHVGTGNYHSETAKTYEDLGVLTADPSIGHDLVKLFNFFTGHAMHDSYRKLLVAPENMRERFTELVRREAAHARDGDGGRIVAKVNRLEDPDIVEELYRASMAGVEVDLVVRDICRLRPGVEGVSETVTVRSIVGRFLEHSRVFYFENAGDERFYIGSADWMERNLDNRVEAVTPVEDDDLRERLRAILRLNLQDNRRAWEMAPDGSYTRCRPGDEAVVDTHARLMREARDAAERARTDDGVVLDLVDSLAPEEFEGPP